MNLEETIYFYTRNDYLIINNLLCGNMNHLWEVAEMVNHESINMLKEHEDGIRTLDLKSIARYQNRIYEKLDEEAKAKILTIAVDDISIIIGSMKPAKNPMKLYRTVWYARIGDVLKCYKVNDIVEFTIISSTSITPYREDAGFEFYRCEITVPKNGLVLELDTFDCFVRNEDGEVLLPPMKCKVNNIRKSDYEKCISIIELEYIESIPVNINT